MSAPQQRQYTVDDVEQLRRLDTFRARRGLDDLIALRAQTELVRRLLLEDPTDPRRKALAAATLSDEADIAADIWDTLVLGTDLEVTDELEHLINRLCRLIGTGDLAELAGAGRLAPLIAAHPDRTPWRPIPTQSNPLNPNPERTHEP